MENLRIRRAGFAYKKDYDLFLKRYKSLCPLTWPHYRDGNSRMGSVLLVTHLSLKENIDYSLGRTKIFIRSSKLFFELEDMFTKRKDELASKIKARYKGYKERIKFLKIKRAGKYINNLNDLEMLI
jgi:myosin-1